METIRTLTPPDAQLIGDIIAAGFRDDPVNLWVFGGTRAMRPVFTAMAQHLYLRTGYGHMDTGGQGGTLWLPSGASKKYGIVGNLKMAQAILHHGGLRAIRNSLAIDAFMARHRPAEPHHYLFAIAVRPGGQGKGLGGRLMRAALTQVDQSGLPAYLENSKPRNIGFYQAHGFEVMDELIPAPGCPPLWRMWRTPR